MSISSIVKLRACDRCRFVFDMTEYNGNRNCPLCQFSTHSATIIHGERAKEFLKTQEPMQKRLLALKREEAIIQFERDIEHATTIRRNIVKEKLNIADAGNTTLRSNPFLGTATKGLTAQALQTNPFFRTTDTYSNPDFAASLVNMPSLKTPPSGYGIGTISSEGVTPSSYTPWEAVKKIWKDEENEKKKE